MKLIFALITFVILVLSHSWCFNKCSLKAKWHNFSKFIPQVWQSFCWGDIFQMLEQLRWWLMRLSNWVIYLLLPSFDGKLSTNKKYEPVQLNKSTNYTSNIGCMLGAISRTFGHDFTKNRANPALLFFLPPRANFLLLAIFGSRKPLWLPTF